MGTLSHVKINKHGSLKLTKTVYICSTFKANIFQTVALGKVKLKKLRSQHIFGAPYSKEL